MKMSRGNVEIHIPSPFQKEINNFDGFLLYKHYVNESPYTEKLNFR